MVNRQNCIFIKYSSGIHDVDSCFLSGIPLMDLYGIFDNPSKLVLAYNDFDNMQMVGLKEFEEYTKDRFKYYDIVCADIKEGYNSDELIQKNTLNNFIKANTPTPIAELPDEIKSFCIYSHDDGLYSYVCFRPAENLFVLNLVKTIFQKAGKALNITVNNDLATYFSTLFRKGIAIDLDSIEIRNKHLLIHASIFHNNDPFSDMVYSNTPLFFKDISILL